MPTSCYAGQCIVVFGTASLQRYIFQSNRLRENIGASYLAKHWLEKGLVKAVSADTTDWDRYTDNPLRCQRKNKDINLIYVGGGKAALLCKSQESAKNAVKTWSAEVQKEAPGLRVSVGSCEVDNSIATAYHKALTDLVRCEEALPFGIPLYSLPVVRTCTSTGLPASELKEKVWISQSAACKQNAVIDAQKVISNEFHQILRRPSLPRQRFAIELEDLGGYEGQSHIAVVHADGNGMGDKLMKVVNESTLGDEAFLEHIRQFSASVTRLSKKALQQTLEHLKEFLPSESLHNPKEIFPLRPIVHGGDDLTFVCDGRLGLHLAAFYLKKFKGEIPIVDRDEPVSACAGVAIVPTKFPFARAYDFAEELCGLAKEAHRKDNENSSWLDFQLIPEGATTSITELRNAQYYSLKGQTLHQRPYQVSETWEGKPNTFIETLKWFQSSKWPRSRAKNLLRALAQGPSATQRFVEGARWRNLKLPQSNTLKYIGWTGLDDAKEATTPYFDPLEVLDFYLPELLK